LQPGQGRALKCLKRLRRIGWSSKVVPDDEVIDIACYNSFDVDKMVEHLEKVKLL